MNVFDRELYNFKFNNMEKEVNKFKDTAMVILKDKLGSNVTQLLNNYQEFSSSFLPPEYSICYDLYINGVKINGDFLNPYDDYIINADTHKEITENDIKSFLNEI